MEVNEFYVSILSALGSRPWIGFLCVSFASLDVAHVASFISLWSFFGFELIYHPGDLDLATICARLRHTRLGFNGLFGVHGSPFCRAEAIGVES